MSRKPRKCEMCGECTPQIDSEYNGWICFDCREQELIDNVEEARHDYEAAQDNLNDFLRSRPR